MPPKGRTLATRPYSGQAFSTTRARAADLCVTLLSGHSLKACTGAAAVEGPYSTRTYVYCDISESLSLE